MEEKELTKTKQILKGVELIRKHQPNAEFAAAHDTIFFGACDNSKDMTSEDIEQLEEWGWYEEYDSWAINT